MKTNFTYKTCSFFALILILALSLNLNGQTTYNVAVTNYAFTPSQLTITAGDKIIWKNNGGSHNVNGTQSTFANNPASFGNNLGTGWTYEYVFSTAGTYNYQCDPHADMGMVGKVIVNPKTVTSSQALADGGQKIQLYPNPASQYIQLMVPVNYATISLVKIYNIAGTVVDEKVLSENAESYKYDVSQLKNGIYLMEITSENQRNVLKFIKQ
jgi:plastocyanin